MAPDDLDIRLLRNFAAGAAGGSFAAGAPLASCSQTSASARHYSAGLAARCG